MKSPNTRLRTVLVAKDSEAYVGSMFITLEADEEALGALPLEPGERERHMQIELACRYYARNWLSFGQAARMAVLDEFALAGELAERGIPRNFMVRDALEDLANARRQ